MTYRLYLTREFERRCRKNSRYSLRAFARDLGLPASRLSEILRVQSGLSEAAAEKLIPKLNLSNEEMEYFQIMVAAEHSRSQLRRKQAQEKLRNLQQKNAFPIFDTEKARVISDWYYSAILELTDVCDFVPSEEWIAGRLAIPLASVHLAVQRLFQFGLLVCENDRWVQTDQQLTFQTDKANLDFKKHHLQMLEKAQQAITELSNEIREISSVTMALSSSQLSEFKNELSSLRKKLMTDAQSAPSKDRVYGLTVHLFPIDQSQSQRGYSK